ncbi:MAG: GHKL domain-containing protein [bacterium]|nr:GHKL domain-containing protein [bacterium]
MPTTELLVLCLGLLVVGLLFNGGVSRRQKASSFGYVPFAWAALVANGVVRVTPLPDELEFFFGLLFATLLLAGAIAYAGRPVPRSLLLAAAGVGTGLTLLGLAGFESVARICATTFESIAILRAASVVHVAAGGEGRVLVDRFIAPGLVLVALVDVLDNVFIASGVDVGITPWTLVGVPVVSLQAASRFEQMKTRAENADTALGETVSLLQATLEATADGILALGPNGEHPSFNRVYGEMWGIPEEIRERGDGKELLTTVMSRLEDPDAFYSQLQALHAQPDRESFGTLTLKDGRIFERYTRPQRVGDTIVGRVWSFRDVTGRKRAEAVAARHQNRLEELVDERTRELRESQDRLRQADRLAAVGTLTAGVAHQINNPVGAILNAAEYALLCEEDEDVQPVYRRALGECVHEAKRCAAIVRSMLQFARQEPVEMAAADLNRTVQIACRAISIYSHEKGATIDVELCGAPLPVLMSEIEIEQVLVNILRNAIESLDQGGEVRVRTEREANLALVHIVDNGCGMDAEGRDRIFDPFYSTRRDQGGTGLGLSVAHGIIAQHGGELRVSSEAGMGTAFAVELPLCEKDLTQVPALESDLQG